MTPHLGHLQRKLIKCSRSRWFMGKKAESVAVSVGGRHCVLKDVTGSGSPLSGGHMFRDVAGCLSIHSLVERTEVDN